EQRQPAEEHRRHRSAAEREGHRNAQRQEERAADEQRGDQSPGPSAIPANSSLSRKRRRLTYGSAISSRCTRTNAKPVANARETPPIGTPSRGGVCPQVSSA